MSYDIYFVDRGQNQSWEEALEALEKDGDEPSLSADLIAAWGRIVPQARMILGDVDPFESDESLELTHQASGLQMSIYGDEVGITIPYWHSGDQAASVLAMAYRLSVVIEKETGLKGFDPQVGIPLSELSPPDAIDLMSGITNDLRQRYGGGSSS